jgi:anaerobic magnesium-protoporphyrin IX monomethyl ester cyclase
MEVLLVNPPEVQSKYKEFLGLTAPPLGLAYIAAVLEENGVKVKILDAPALNMDFYNYRKAISQSNVDVLGVQTTTPTIRQALQVAQITKEEHPDCVVTLGGYHATFMPNQILRQNDFVDVIVRNEGEYTTLEVVDAIENDKPLKNIDGINYKEDNVLIETPQRPPIESLDSLPFPARHLLPMDQYMVFGRKHQLATMICSRGCPMGCSFCASSAMHGKRARFRSPENAVDELENVVDDYRVSMIGFMDDTFTLYPSWVSKFCELITKRGVDVKWGCTARVDRMDKQLLKQMKEAGCRTLLLGVESGNQGILNNVQKGATIDQARKTFELARDVGMHTIASMTVGMPGETKVTADETMSFTRRVNPDYAIFSLATPYPGTKFFDLAEKMGLIKVKDWTHFNLIMPVLETAEFSLDELQEMQIKAFKDFYMRPGYLLRQFKKDRLIFLLILYNIFKGAIKSKFKSLFGVTVDPHVKEA